MKIKAKMRQIDLWRSALTNERINYRVGEYPTMYSTMGEFQDRFHRWIYLSEPIPKREVRRIMLKYGIIQPKNKRDWTFVHKLAQGE